MESGFDLYMWKGFDDGDAQEQTWFRVATDGGCKTAFCNQQAAFPNVHIKTCHLTGQDTYQGGSDELCMKELEICVRQTLTPLLFKGTAEWRVPKWIE